MIYIVEYIEWDCGDYFIVEGPEQEDWSEYCRSLYEETLNISLKEEFITWDSVFDELKNTLQKYGYKVIRPIIHKVVNYYDSSEADNKTDKEITDKIEEYQEKWRRKNDI